MSDKIEKPHCDVGKHIIVCRGFDLGALMPGVIAARKKRAKKQAQK